MNKTFRSFLPIILTAFACVSCAATMPAKREPKKAPAQAEQDLKTAQANIKSGDMKKATARLKKIIKENDDSDVADDAHLLLGHIQYNQQQYAEAVSNYDAIVKSELSSPHEPEARIRAARAYLKLQKPDEASSILDAFNESSAREGFAPTPEQKMEAARIGAEIFVAQKKPVDAIASLAQIAEKHPNAAEREKARAQAQEIFDSGLSEDDVKEIGSDEKYGFLRPVARYRYALILADQKQYSSARSVLQDVTNMAQGTDLAERAQKLISQIDARNKVDPKAVGVVLPLSGPQSAIGYKALRGIQLGLGVYGKNQSGFKLAVVDSEGTTDGARRAVERLVQEDNVIGIIGGLLSKTASAEAARAQDFGVPAIMLSQKSGVTKAGDSIFRNALTSQMQIQQLVDVAMKELGYKKFAIVYPNDAYGVEYANLFWDEVKSRGGDITGAQPYDPKETDFRGHIQRLTGLFYQEDRAAEFQARSRLYYEKNPKRSARQGGPSVEDILPPIVDFDAIFIPDSARAVGQIAPMLAYNNVRNVRLLGTNIWNSPSVIQRGQKFVEDSIFIDSVLATSPDFKNSKFYTSFKEAFEEEPGLMELQAYDSALILRQLIAGGESSRIGLQASMSQLQNFPGALGPLSISEDREFKRPTTVLTISKGQIIPLGSQPQ